MLQTSKILVHYLGDSFLAPEILVIIPWVAKRDRLRKEITKGQLKVQNYLLCIRVWKVSILFK
jgi:hypothetical protein